MMRETWWGRLGAAWDVFYELHPVIGMVVGLIGGALGFLALMIVLFWIDGPVT